MLAVDSYSITRLHLIIHGHVQGVGFRWSVCRQARKLGLTGWVKNLLDGTVEILAEGARRDLEALLAWSETGPPFAQVETPDVSWEAPSADFMEFTIR